MAEKKIGINLIYKDETRKMNFIPKSYEELKDHFLYIFKQKSSKKFKFYIKEQNNQKKLIDEKQNLFQNTIKKISQENNLIIYISEEDNVFTNRGENGRIFSYEAFKGKNIDDKNEENKSEVNNKIYNNKISQAHMTEFGDIKDAKNVYYYKCESSVNNEISDNNDNPYRHKYLYKRQNTYNTENPYIKNDNGYLNDIKELNGDELTKDGNEEKSINCNLNLSERNYKSNKLNSFCLFQNNEKEKKNESLNDIKDNQPSYLREKYVSETYLKSSVPVVLNNIRMDNIDIKDKKEEFDNELQLFEFNNKKNNNQINLYENNYVKQNRIEENNVNNYDLIRQKKQYLKYIENHNILIEKQEKELKDKYNSYKKKKS